MLNHEHVLVNAGVNKCMFSCAEHTGALTDEIGPGRTRHTSCCPVAVTKSVTGCAGMPKYKNHKNAAHGAQASLTRWWV